MYSIWRSPNFGTPSMPFSFARARHAASAREAPLRGAHRAAGVPGAERRPVLADLLGPRGGLHGAGGAEHQGAGEPRVGAGCHTVCLTRFFAKNKACLGLHMFFCQIHLQCWGTFERGTRVSVYIYIHIYSYICIYIYIDIYIYIYTNIDICQWISVHVYRS